MIRLSRRSGSRYLDSSGEFQYCLSFSYVDPVRLVEYGVRARKSSSTKLKRKTACSTVGMLIDIQGVVNILSNRKCIAVVEVSGQARLLISIQGDVNISSNRKCIEMVGVSGQARRQRQCIYVWDMQSTFKTNSLIYIWSTKKRQTAVLYSSCVQRTQQR